MRAGLIKFILPVAFTLFASSSPLAQDPKLVGHFDYDKNTPLDIKTVGTESRGEARVYDITYASPKGGDVPAYLVVPAKAKRPFAAIVWGHWYWQNSEMRNRKQFLDEAVALAQVGVVSLLTDGPVARPGHIQDRTPLNEQQATDMVQQVIDMRRGLDLLLARKDVDPKRIAFVGHSYNASVGAILSGVDRRFQAFVLMASTMSDEVDQKSEEYQNFRKKVGPEKFDSFMAAHSYLDCGRYVSHAAPAIVFLQYATQEDFLTPERAREYERVVSEPKRFKLYEAPHALNKEARRDRIAFLTEQLKLKPLPANMIDGIPDLYQPPRPN